MPAGEHVQPRGGEIHAGEQLRAAELGHANADGVAVALRRQGPYADPLHLGKLAFHGPVVVEFPPDHVGIETHAADVLAHPVDHQHVDLWEGEPRQPAAGQNEQLFLALGEARRLDGLDKGRAVVGDFHDRQAGQDTAFPQHFARHAVDDLVETVVLDGAMIDGGPSSCPGR